MNRRPERAIILAAVFSLSLLAAPAWGGAYGFKAIDTVSPSVAAVGEAQLSLEVSEPSAGRVQFMIRNEGPAASTVTLVAFNNAGPLRGIVGIIDADTTGHQNVDFAFDTRPKALPGAEDQFTTVLSSSPVGPPMEMGINPGEYLGLVFALKSSTTMDDLLAALDSNVFRMGLYLQGVLMDGEGAFLSVARLDSNQPVPVVPVPGSVVLGMIGVSAVGMWQRRRMAHATQ